MDVMHNAHALMLGGAAGRHRFGHLSIRCQVRIAAGGDNHVTTRPIKPFVVIIDENITFDHYFATVRTHTF
jgi:phospholipase C